MAKTPKVKILNPSKHSRAARRAAEPLTKTLADQVDEADEIRHIKQTQRQAGVSKKRNKTKALTRSQRLRREKGVERAEAVMDQLAIKRAVSSGRGKTAKERSGAWDDVNGRAVREVKSASSSFAVLRMDNGDAGIADAEEDWEDVDVDVASRKDDAMQEQSAIEAVTALHLSGELQPPLGSTDADDDEVL